MARKQESVNLDTQPVNPETSEPQDEVFSDFNFNKSLDTYEREALIPAGIYTLIVDDFTPRVKVVTAENMKPNNTIGDRIPYLSLKLKHAEGGDLYRGRRYDLLLWDLRNESTRAQVGLLYRAFGYTGTYVPKYTKAEFFDSDGKGKTATFQIDRFVNKQTGKEVNGRPKIPDLKKVVKQEKKDSAAADEIEF